MSPHDAAKIVALQPVIEDLILEVADNPEMVTDPGPQYVKLIELVKRLCCLDAGKFGSEEQQNEAAAASFRSGTGGLVSVLKYFVKVCN